MLLTTALLITAGISAAASLAGGIAGQAMQNKSVKETNEANKEIHDEDLKFNADQAQLEKDFNAEQAELSRQFNADQAEKQRAWETQMANTAVQRKAADLQAAGFNPALAISSPASTPAGASASSSATSANAARSSGAIPMQAMNYSPTAQMANNLSHLVSSAGSIIALQKLTKSHPLAMAQLAKTTANVSKAVTSADKVAKLARAIQA